MFKKLSPMFLVDNIDKVIEWYEVN